MTINFHWMQRIHWPCDQYGMVEMAKTLEEANIVSVLLPYGPEGEDFSMFMPDVFRATKKIKMMLAVGAYAVAPEYVAKTFYTAQKFALNRLSLNLVAGRYSDHFEQMAINYYHLDPSIMNEHKKRVAITEKWMEKFTTIIEKERYKADLAVVGSSDLTIDIANRYTDYIIINGWMLNDPQMKKITNAKPILVLDPLILENGQKEEDVQYNDYKFASTNHHPIKGTYEEVAKQILGMSQAYNINDFMIHTDQKDISQLLRLVKDLSDK